MANREEALKAFAEMIVSDKELAEKVKAALADKNLAMIAALAQEKGLELAAADFELPETIELDGKEIDPAELENVAGGLGGTFEWATECSWYAAVACGLAAGGFLWMGDHDYSLGV